jgi:hypothetical protein
MDATVTITASKLFRPRAKSWQYAITAPQAKYIRDLARQRGTDAERLAIDAFDCPLTDLSRTAAKKLIRHLLSAAEQVQV